MNNTISMTASETAAFDNCAAGLVTGKDIERLKFDPEAIGTAAHEYAEIMLKGKLGLGDVEALNQRRITFEKYSLFYNVSFEYEVMKYVDYCVSLVSHAKKVDEQPVIFVEEWLEMGKWAPEQTSKVDFALIAGGTLVIVDMKTGAFGELAENNKQLLFYALAMMKKYYSGYNVRNIVLTIVNTKTSETISSVEMTSDELLRRGNEMRDRNETMDLRADYTTEHCSVCNLGSRCRHHYEYMTERLGYMMNEDAVIDIAAEGSEMYRKANDMKKYGEEMKETIRREAITRGIKVDGYKLIHGNPTTKYSDDKALMRLLIEKFPEASLELLEPLSYAKYKKIKGRFGDDVLRVINGSGLVKHLDNKSRLVPESQDGVVVSHKQAILDVQR